MIFQTLFTASPLLLCGGLFIKNKKLCCLYCGVIFFLFSAFYNYEFFASVYGQWGIGMKNLLSPGFIYGWQIFSMFLSAQWATVLWGLVSSFLLMFYIYRYCYYPALSAVTAAISGLWLINFINPCLFLGILVSAFGFRYASERRFVRFSAFMLLAAAFDLRLLAVIPLYILFITKPTLYHIPAAAVIGAALMYFDISPVLGYIPGFSGERMGAQLFYPVTVMAVGVITAVAAKIIMRRSDYYGTMVTVMAVAAAFAFGATGDGRLMLISVVCFFPTVLAVIPETVMILKSIITLTFRDNKKPVLIAGGILSVVGLAVYYIFLMKNSGFEYELWLTGQAVLQ